MTEQGQPTATILSFASAIPGSFESLKLSEDIFALAEEVAAYAEKALIKKLHWDSPGAALMYTNQCMHLTSRIVSMGSWALFLKALAKKEMALEQFIKENDRSLVFRWMEWPECKQIPGAPSEFSEFTERTIGLRKRIIDLTNRILGESPINMSREMVEGW